MNKLISSIATVAVAFSVAANARETLAPIKVDGVDSNKTTVRSVVDSGINVIRNAGEAALFLTDAVASLPGDALNKAAQVEECVNNNIEAFHAYKGSAGVSMVFCSGRGLVKGFGLLVEKSGGVASKIAAVPASALRDLSNAVLADVTTIEAAMNDKVLARIPGMTALQLGYVVTALSVGVVGNYTANMFQFTVDVTGAFAVAIINGVETGIAIAQGVSIIMVHYGIEAAEAAYERVLLLTNDVVLSAIDGYATASCGAAVGAKKVTRGLIGFAGSLLSQEPNFSQGSNPCDSSNLAQDAFTVVLRLVSLPVRVFTNESWEQMKAHADAQVKTYKRSDDARGY